MFAELRSAELTGTPETLKTRVFLCDLRRAQLSKIGTERAVTQ